jgi:hypothetical protein
VPSVSFVVKPPRASPGIDYRFAEHEHEHEQEYDLPHFVIFVYFVVTRRAPSALPIP